MAQWEDDGLKIFSKYRNLSVDKVRILVEVGKRVFFNGAVLRLLEYVLKIVFPKKTFFFKSRSGKGKGNGMDRFLSMSSSIRFETAEN
jgi:hypothetical protein